MRLPPEPKANDEIRLRRSNVACRVPVAPAAGGEPLGATPGAMDMTLRAGRACSAGAALFWMLRRTEADWERPASSRHRTHDSGRVTPPNVAGAREDGRASATGPSSVRLLVSSRTASWEKPCQAVPSKNSQTVRAEWWGGNSLAAGPPGSSGGDTAS